MTREYVKAYARKHYDSIRYESVYALKKLIASLTYEAGLLGENSPVRWLLEEQLMMAREALDQKQCRPSDQKEVTNGTWFRAS